MFLANIFDCIITDDLIPFTIKKCRTNMILSGSKGRNFQPIVGIVTSQIMKKKTSLEVKFNKSGF